MLQQGVVRQGIVRFSATHLHTVILCKYYLYVVVKLSFTFWMTISIIVIFMDNLNIPDLRGSRRGATWWAGNARYSCTRGRAFYPWVWFVFSPLHALCFAHELRVLWKLPNYKFVEFQKYIDTRYRMSWRLGYMIEFEICALLLEIPLKTPIQKTNSI